MLRRISRPTVLRASQGPYRFMASNTTVFRVVLEQDKKTKNQHQFSADRAKPDVKMDGRDYDYGATGATFKLYLTRQFLQDANLREDLPIKVTIEQQHPADVPKE
ncbi:hypothetical protein M885DRAFT_558497 [Pelagophyceae sp. CCMP2097]|nr:hypothetical protein M885DRAFT_558497 [Pelagophyceae sp. CCMP2097]